MIKGLKRGEFDVVLPRPKNGAGGGEGGGTIKGVQQLPGSGDNGKGAKPEKYSPDIDVPPPPSGGGKGEGDNKSKSAGSGKDGESSGREQDDNNLTASGKIENVGRRGVGGMVTDRESKALQDALGVPYEAPPTAEEIKEEVRKIQPLLDKHTGSREAGVGKGKNVRLLPEAIAKLINPIIDWKSLLRKYIGRIIGDRSEAVMPNRRFSAAGEYVYGSRKSKTKLKTCVIAVDVSGSVGHKELLIMINEIKGIAASRRLKYFEIVYFDHGIQHVEKLNDSEVASYKPTAVGGGGTSFKEPIEYMINVAKKGDLDLAVFMTDGYAALDIPVPKFKDKFIWFVLDHPSFKAPWGNKVVFVDVASGKGRN